jgi:hypothetical protein
MTISAGTRFGAACASDEPGQPVRSAIATRIEARNEYVVSADGNRFVVNSKLDRSAPVAVVLNRTAGRRAR